MFWARQYGTAQEDIVNPFSIEVALLQYLFDLKVG